MDRRRRRPRLWAALAFLAAVACHSDTTGPAGPPSASRSLVEVTNGVVASGETTSVQLVLMDAGGNRVEAGGNTVAFGLMAGTSGGTMGPALDLGNGTYTTTFTGIVAGTPATVTASIDGSPVTSPLPTIQVVPGPVSLAVSVIDVSPGTVTRGGQATITLDTRDAAGNPLGKGGLGVAFAAGGGTATGTMSPVTDQGDGHYTAVFTGTGLGSPLTIGGTVDGMPLTSALPTLSVAYGVAGDSSVISVSSDTVSVNQGITLTLQVRDSAGVARTSGGDTVAFSFQNTGAGDGTIDSTTDLGDGSYTASFTASQAGAVIIGATLNGRAVGGTQPMVSILGASVNPQNSGVSVSRDTVAAGDSATLTLTVRDLDSNQTAAAGLSIVFTAGDGTTGGGTIGPVTDHGDGTYTAQFTGMRAGPAAEIGAVINDTGQVQMLDSTGASQLPTITVIPGPVAPDSSVFSASPSRVNVGDSALLRLDTRDGYGNALRQGGLAVSFQRTGGAGVSVGHLGAVADQGDGTYLAHYFADTAGVGDTLSALIGGVPVTTAMPVIEVTCTAGPVNLQQSVITVNDTTSLQSPSSQVALPSGVTTTITLQLRDDHGCAVTASHSVSFSATGGTSTGQLGATVDQGDGSYTATFTGMPWRGPRWTVRGHRGRQCGDLDFTHHHRDSGRYLGADLVRHAYTCGTGFRRAQRRHTPCAGRRRECPGDGWAERGLQCGRHPGARVGRARDRSGERHLRRRLYRHRGGPRHPRLGDRLHRRHATPDDAPHGPGGGGYYLARSIAGIAGRDDRRGGGFGAAYPDRQGRGRTSTGHGRPDHGDRLYPGRAGHRRGGNVAEPGRR